RSGGAGGGGQGLRHGVDAGRRPAAGRVGARPHPSLSRLVVGGRAGGGYALDFTTFCCCSPSPSMPRRTTSPALRNCGGFMPRPTPGGVPVMITSPGSITKNCEQYQTRCATPNTMVLVLPFCRVSPLTVSHML